MDKFIGDFHKNLRKEVSGLKEVTIIEYCDFILYFCLITSRAGTDIDAAIRNLNEVAADKQVIMGVLFLTIDPEKTIPDSNSTRNEKNIYYVDFLFKEDEGFMKCPKNDDAIKKLARYMKSKNLTSYYLQNYGNSRTHSYQDAEDTHLMSRRQEDRSGGILRIIRRKPVISISIVVVVVVVICIVVGIILGVKQ